jgi:endogenous inhibitor of DNA gyrase (YacG/DUF329 family)
MAKPTCPLCGKPRDETYKPFCSKRCADIDLGNWLGEKYRVPDDGPARIDDDDEDGAPPAGRA